MMKDKIPQKETDAHVKRFSLNSEETQHVHDIQSVMAMLAIQREGLNYSMTLQLARARNRMHITEEDAPAGYTRSVDYDPEKNQLVVTDTPIGKERKEIKNAAFEVELDGKQKTQAV